MKLKFKSIPSDIFHYTMIGISLLNPNWLLYLSKPKVYVSVKTIAFSLKFFQILEGSVGALSIMVVTNKK